MDTQGTGGGGEEQNATTQYKQGTVLPVEASRGGAGGCVDGEGRQREEGTPGRENPGGDRDLIAQVKDGKGGGGRKREGRHRLARGTPWDAQQGRKSQMSGGVRQVGAPSRWTVSPRPVEMGREKWVQKEREAVSTGERWREIGDRYGGREKRNERSRKKVEEIVGGKG